MTAAFITDSKKRQAAGKIFTALCLAAIVTCVICDLAINRLLSWSLLTLSAVLFAWVLALPALLMKKWAAPLTLAVFSGGAPAYLYVTERILNGDWYAALALPIALACIAAAWVCWILWRFAKLNNWHKAAGYVLVFMVVDIVAEVLTNQYLGLPRWRFNDIITVLAFVTVCVLLCIIGLGKKPGREEEGGGWGLPK